MNTRKPQARYLSRVRQGGLPGLMAALGGMLRSLARSVRPDGSCAVELLCGERVYLFGEEQMIALLPPPASRR